MSICVVDGKHCDCQPDEGSYCQKANAAIAREAELSAENERLQQRIAELEEDNASLYDENRTLAHMPSRIDELDIQIKDLNGFIMELQEKLCEP